MCDEREAGEGEIGDGERGGRAGGLEGRIPGSLVLWLEEPISIAHRAEDERGRPHCVVSLFSVTV